MFKIGDVVKRTSGRHAGMSIGDVGTVIAATDRMIKIKEFNTLGWHSSERFVKVSSFKGNK